jgi:predicted ATPase
MHFKSLPAIFVATSPALRIISIRGSGFSMIRTSSEVPGFAVSTFSLASLNAWALGRADVACERSVRMMAAVDESNPFDLAHSAYYAAQLRIYFADYEQAEALAARALDLSEKHLFKFLAPMSRCVLGQARSQLGRAAAGIALIRQGIAVLQEIGMRLFVTNFTAWLAAAQGHEEAIDDALETVEKALRANSEELFYRPEIYRLRGELRIKQGETEGAEADFSKATMLAQQMRAKAWELRATTSLARLLRDTNRRDEARAMLTEIYNWFTEGFGTADLKEAKALLDEISN